MEDDSPHTVMTTLTGTFGLARLYLRLDRVRAPVWVAVLAVLPMVVAVSFAELYSDPLEREQLVATVSATPTLTAFLGPPLSSSIGGLTVWRVGTIAALLIGLLSGLTVIRHTRAEEETERREMVGWTVTGRHAPLTAALLVASLGAGAVGLLAAVGLAATGQPASGAAAFGLGIAGCGIVFAAVAAVAAQLTESAPAARGLTTGTVGVAFAARMIADGGDADWLSWASPVGWTQQLRAFAGEQWWVMALFPALTLLLVACSYVLSAGRDVGGAIFRPRPGPARASAHLSSPLGLVWRLQRTSLLGWVVAFAALGLGVGSLRDGMVQILEENPQLASIFEAIGGERALDDAFLMALFGIFALIASAYGIGALLELQREEEALRAEHVLSTPVSRHRWATGHLAPALIGPAVLLAVGGAGVSIVSLQGDMTGTVGATLVQLPAVWVLVGIAMALYGLSPRRTALAWGALVAFALLGQLGEVLRLPRWAMSLSPFTHVPEYPAGGLDAAPLAGLLAVAAALVALGLVGFSRRDLT